MVKFGSSDILRLDFLMIWLAHQGPKAQREGDGCLHCAGGHWAWRPSWWSRSWRTAVCLQFSVHTFSFQKKERKKEGRKERMKWMNELTIESWKNHPLSSIVKTQDRDGRVEWQSLVSHVKGRAQSVTKDPTCLCLSDVKTVVPSSAYDILR